MLRTKEEDDEDQQAEAEFWQRYEGKTECFGTVAKLVLLVAIVVQAVYQYLA